MFDLGTTTVSFPNAALSLLAPGYCVPWGSCLRKFMNYMLSLVCYQFSYCCCSLVNLEWIGFPVNLVRKIRVSHIYNLAMYFFLGKRKCFLFPYFYLLWLAKCSVSLILFPCRSPVFFIWGSSNLSFMHIKKCALLECKHKHAWSYFELWPSGFNGVHVSFS